MPVVAPKRHLIRGRIRAQTQYAIVLCNRLLKAYHQNPDLPLFTGTDGPGGTLNMSQAISQWEVGLLAKG
jgi:hypothetical protein